MNATLRNYRIPILIGSMLLPLLLVGPDADAATCRDGWFSISGTVTDEFTGLPLETGTSVGVREVDGPYFDDDVTMVPVSTFEYCVPAGSYTLRFFNDDYYREIYDDVTTVAEATVVTGVSGDMITGLDAALRPFPIITGRVTDSGTGQPLHTSVGLHDAVTGDSLDGEGTDANGVFKWVINPAYYPVPGSYQIAFHADYHWSEWFDNAKKRSKATVIHVTEASGIISGIDAELRPCNRPIPDFCLPGSFGR